MAVDNASVCGYWSVSRLIFEIISPMMIWTRSGCLSSVLICVSVFLSVLINSIFVRAKRISCKSFQFAGRNGLFYHFFLFKIAYKNKAKKLCIISVTKQLAIQYMNWPFAFTVALKIHISKTNVRFRSQCISMVVKPVQATYRDST